MATTANNWRTPSASDPGRYTRAQCQFLFFPVFEFYIKGIPNGVQLTCQFLMIIYGPKEAPRVKELGQKSPELSTSVEGTPPYWARPLSHGPLGRPPTYFFVTHRIRCARCPPVIRRHCHVICLRVEFCHVIMCISFCIRVRFMHPTIFPVVRFAIRHSYVLQRPPVVSHCERVLNVL